MPNIAKILKEEITRLSRKEAKAAVTPFRKPSVRSRKDMADLKRRMVLLEKLGRQLQDRLAKMDAVQPAAPTEPSAREWISGRGIKSLRKRLGLSQSELAKLVGVSEQAVYMWEQKPGMLRLRTSTKASVFSIRDLGAREARKRLEEMAKAKQPKKAKKPLSKRLRR